MEPDRYFGGGGSHVRLVITVFREHEMNFSNSRSQGGLLGKLTPGRWN